eukprot:1155365-Pelagomonas_calceolata.AAC.3
MFTPMLRLCGLWGEAASADHGGQANKITEGHHWVALPLKQLTVHGVQEHTFWLRQTCWTGLVTGTFFTTAKLPPQASIAMEPFPFLRQTCASKCNALLITSTHFASSDLCRQEHTSECDNPVKKRANSEDGLLFCLAGTVKQAEQANYLAEDHIPLQLSLNASARQSSQTTLLKVKPHCNHCNASARQSSQTTWLKV